MSKIEECWEASLALRERNVVAKLLASASEDPMSWWFKDVDSLTRDLAEIDLVIAGHRAGNR